MRRISYIEPSRFMALVLVGIILGLLLAIAVTAQINLPPWSPTPDQEAMIEGEIAFDRAIYDSIPTDVQWLVPTNLPRVVMVAALPEISVASTNPPPPKMTVDMFPSYLAAELTADVREQVDAERRPKVYFQKRSSLTNEWEDVLVLEPWRMAEFYRVVVKAE